MLSTTTGQELEDLLDLRGLIAERISEFFHDSGSKPLLIRFSRPSLQDDSLSLSSVPMLLDGFAQFSSDDGITVMEPHVGAWEAMAEP